jgi:hypothetical protein
MPVLAEQAYEWGTGHNEFLDRRIVPRSEEDLSPERQFGPYTTNVAKRLGELPTRIGRALGFEGEDAWRGLSPRKIDNLIRGIFGGLGGDLAEMLGTVGGEPSFARSAPGGEIPGVGLVLGEVTKRFVRSGRTSQAVNDFYERRTRLLELARGGDDPRLKAASRVAERFARRMKTLRDRRNEPMPGLSLRQKAEKRKEWLRVMRNLAHEANRVLDAVTGRP